MANLHARPCALVAALGFVLFSAAPARANDSIFPASTPDAAAKISWTNGFFRIDGKPVFLRSGEIHYARVPRELWRDRLVRAKRAGLNTIQTYVFWNAHEPRENEFTFDGDLDLDAWLSLIEELGMYAVVRPGPYNCAEWESGGIPAWLTVKPNMQIRNSYPDYLAAADAYYEHVIPILAKHQIHRGGSLLMMQVENEDFAGGWGTEGDDYLKHLYDKARSLGMEIPLFYSGLHHANDPAGTTPFGARDVPWYSTEFWTGWFDYGGEPSEAETLRLARGTWKILAFGGGGYDYYVVHGGTNFGYESDDQLPTSYDYRAPIGEEGQLHKSYPEAKRAAMFAGTFADILATAHDGGGTASPKVANGITAYVRASDGGNVVFLDNPGNSAISSRLALTAPAVDLPETTDHLTVAAGEIRPVVVDAAWTANARFDTIVAGVLGRITLGGTGYLVTYGRAGEAGEVAIHYSNPPSKAPAAPWQWDAAKLRAKTGFTFPTGDAVAEIPIDSGDGSHLVFLVMNTDLANRTWFTDDALFVGASYLDDKLAMDFPIGGGSASQYTAGGKKTFSASSMTMPAPAAISSWTRRSATDEAQSAYSDSAWTSSQALMPMSAYDSFQNGFGWYRTVFHADGPQSGSLVVDGIADRAIVFVDGQLSGDIKNATVSVGTGDHTLAVLASQEGRSKLAGYNGPTGTIGYKGIWGKAAIGETSVKLNSFRMSINGVDSSGASTYAAPGFDDSSWQIVASQPDSMGGQVTYAWYRAGFDQANVSGTYNLWLGGADDHAWVYVNGHLIGTHDDWRTSALFDVGSNLLSGHNVVAICIKNDAGAGGLTGPIEIRHVINPLTGPWKFHGGIGGMAESALVGRVSNWDAFVGGAWEQGTAPSGSPAFFRADVPNPLLPKARTTVGLKTTGMSKGAVWVNGHNLGLFDGEVLLYVPEPWLASSNTLVIYDEQGKTPDQVHFEYFEVQTENTDLVVSTPDAGPTPDGGGDAAADASNNPVPADATVPDGAAGASPNGSSQDSACNCRLGGEGGSNGGALASLLGGALAILAASARRRRAP